MQNNENQPAPFYYKYIFLALVGISIILFLFVFGSLFKGCSVKQEETSETINEEIEIIEILDLKKYNACVIWEKTPYYLFEEITLNKNLLNKNLGKTSKNFYFNKNNKYKAINGATYQYDEGLDIYSLNNSDELGINNDYGLGLALFVKDYNEYKEKYKITNRQSGEVFAYLNIVDNDFDTKVKLNIEDVKNFDSFDMDQKLTGYKNILITISEKDYTYSYNAMYSEMANHIIIYDYLNKIAIDGKFMEVVDENN